MPKQHKMHLVDNITVNDQTKKLKDFIPLVITFFVGLIVLSIYQYTALYFSGVLDSVLNKSLFVLLLHHLGYASVCSIFLVFLFNYLESKKPSLGFKTVKILLLLFLLLETALVNYYVQNYEAIGTNFLGIFNSNGVRFSTIQTLGVFGICILICHYSYKYISTFYKAISRMYPFTIILFSLFLATLYSEKRTVNENKTQHLAEHIAKQLFDDNTYEGTTEYPLVKPHVYKTELNQYFDLKKEKPTIKLIIVEGLGDNLINNGATYKGFMPHLSSLKNKSLFWNNFLSNTGESHASLPTIIGSLPFGEKGFTHLEELTDRNTLYSILKSNGYKTSFNYGGNNALHFYDRFLAQEGVSNILDKNSFGQGYHLQKEDAAGVSLGYPDKELFKRYLSETHADSKPKLDVFLTLSTKAPYQIPKKEEYINRVEEVMVKSNFQGKTKRVITKNKELFASFIYADEAIAEFLSKEQKRPGYENTIFIITGSHHTTNLPRPNALSRYRVPLLLYSPMLKEGKEIKEIAAHTDIAPTLLSLLNNEYKLKIPNEVAWLGNDLQMSKEFLPSKKIPLLRGSNTLQDYVSGNYFLTEGDVYKIDEDLSLSECEDEDEISIEEIKDQFTFFKSVNAYVTDKNKIMPKSFSLVTRPENEFTREETIWIQSVFNGNDFDNAYKTARNLAIGENWERALLLCRYILSEIPRHADAEILMGRLYAWKGDYDKSIEVLEEVIHKYPKYDDAYCALLDTFYWSDQDEKVFQLNKIIEKNNLNQTLLSKKLERSILRAKEKELQNIEGKNNESSDEIAKNNIP